MAALCPNCGKMFPTRKLVAGSTVPCDCGATLRVPVTMDGMASHATYYLEQAVDDEGQGGDDADLAATAPMAVRGADKTPTGSVTRPTPMTPTNPGTQDTPGGRPDDATPTVFKEMDGKDALFSSSAVEKGLITWRQVNECIETQGQLEKMGIEKSLDQVLLDKKFLSPMQVMRLREELEAGKNLNEIGGFRIVGRVGKGGMGTVYRARQISLQRDVALKILPKQLASDMSYIERFLMEARSAAQLRHPNIVQAIDVGEDRGFYYFAMELVEGQSTNQLLNKLKILPIAEAVRITAQTSRALEHAWERARMIHRDIKPDNILIEKDGTAKLADMGLSKSQKAEKNLTHSGTILGTPNYISPEQAEGKRDLDQRADLYSLGCTIYHFLTGVPPFDDDSAAMILLGHMTKPVPDPRGFRPDIPATLAEYVMQMMAKDPADRPQTAKDVAEFMEKFLDDMASGKAAPAADKKPTLTKPAGSSGKPANAADSAAILQGVVSFEFESDDESSSGFVAPKQEAAAKPAAGQADRKAAPKPAAAGPEAAAAARKQAGGTGGGAATDEKKAWEYPDDESSTGYLWLASESGQTVAPIRRKSEVNVGVLIGAGVLVLGIIIFAIILLRGPAPTPVAVQPRVIGNRKRPGNPKPPEKKDAGKKDPSGNPTGRPDKPRNGQTTEPVGPVKPDDPKGPDKPVGPAKPDPDAVPEWAQVSPSQLQYAREVRLPVAEEFELGPGVKLRALLIPPGEFMMGSAGRDLNANEDERPVHKVHLTQPFYMGIHEVTQKQYESLMGENESQFKAEDNPVDKVSRASALAFCERLGRKIQRRVLLPSEAEWEYACRAGSAGSFGSGGDSKGADGRDFAWLASNAEGRTHPVGAKKSNAWGLYDMHGNVVELCRDCYAKDYYARSPVEDPSGPPENGLYVVRGGSYKTPASRARSTTRAFTSSWGYQQGFRVIIIPPKGSVPGLVRDHITEADLSDEQRRKAREKGLPAVRTIDLGNNVSLSLVLIPDGKYKMGAAKDQKGWQPDETLHDVRIMKPFYVGVYEVTERQFEAVMNENPSLIVDPWVPVHGVSWAQAVAFCRKLSERTGLKMKLPTEAQWEYVCRAGTATPWFFGQDPRDLAAYAWCRDNADGKPHQAGLKRPNPWGLRDIYGNVGEWCADWYGKDYYAEALLHDPVGPERGTRRVLRGGSFASPEAALASARRASLEPTEKPGYVGFRVIMEVEE